MEFITDPKSEKPGFGTVALFGHRTFHGSPFLNLDKLQPGDNLTVEWPGIGNVEYEVVNSTIVPASYRLSIEQGNTLFSGNMLSTWIIKGKIDDYG